MVQSVMSEYKIHSADVCFRDDCTVDELIDVIEGNRIYTPCLFVLNKIDQITMEELDVFSRLPHHVMISAFQVLFFFFFFFFFSFFFSSFLLSFLSFFLFSLSTEMVSLEKQKQNKNYQI